MQLPFTIEQLESQLGFQYQYEEEGNLKMKFTVSELKKRMYQEEEGGEILYEEPEIVPLMPQFLAKEEVLQGASRGSAYHKLLELLDFSQEYDARLLSKTVAPTAITSG